jgi:hypothetical protein
MATVLPTSGRNNYPAIYPHRYISGNSTEITTASGLMIMPETALVVYNEGATDVVLKLIPVGNDETNPITVLVKQYEVCNVTAFNAIVVSGSTGHNLVTTKYSVGWRA